MRTPTPAQKRLLQALIELGGSGYTADLARLVTVRACRANGWITRLPAGQYEVAKHAITAKGRAAIEHTPRPAAERAKIAQGARSANARQRRLDDMARELREAGRLVMLPGDWATIEDEDGNRFSGVLVPADDRHTPCCGTGCNTCL
jgi:hypothetical protein